ncbi:type II toxin-antitoxin system RelE/ParE family toxin [Candidatus Halobeggiatoa sp. HSG11]|nr:type II toxin-antitoxin system RelE/ParE family toxin [Candidatus Halobeggiatoa sp. HSG11]
MIISFKHKGLELFFTKNDKRLLNAKHLKKLSILLDALESAEIIEDLDIPGVKLHQLLGNRKNLWSMKVSGNWRLTFSFNEGNAFDVNLEDYH